MSSSVAFQYFVEIAHLQRVTDWLKPGVPALLYSVSAWCCDCHSWNTGPLASHGW